MLSVSDIFICFSFLRDSFEHAEFSGFIKRLQKRMTDEPAERVSG